ncbi:hypothetical protein CYY_001090 [Polysphondylium violaceum]|uniref:SET domain-containing protein n=1 Tax=Polysphondylium violaceum TaxID=133409 RepID=A0A8J4V8A6_9MYCE|nr:hypothetical protein CYY_001090 [Polysphondylium violaceum]
MSREIEKQQELDRREKTLQRLIADYGLKGKVGMKKSPIHGVGMFAEKDYKVGDIVVALKPYSYISQLDVRCDGCFLLFPMKLSKCSGCNFINYCSKECQQKMWPLHKLECASIKEYINCFKQQERVEENLLHILLIARTINIATLGCQNGGSLALIHNLCDPTEDLDVEENKLIVKKYLEFAQQVRNFLKDSKKPESEFDALVIKIFSNYTQDNETMTLTPILSLFNHSCNGNTILTSPNNMMYLLAQKEIKKGEEITYPYVYSDNKRVRYEILKSRGAICTCQVCDSVVKTGSQDTYYRCHGCNQRVDIRYRSTKDHTMVGRCLGCQKEYSASELKHKGDVIKSNIAERFKSAPVEIKKLFLTLYFEHFHPLHLYLIYLDFKDIYSLDDPNIFKRIELQVLHHYGPICDLALHYFGKIILEREKENRKDRIYAHFINLRRPAREVFKNIFLSPIFWDNNLEELKKKGIYNSSNILTEPDKYFDKTLL